MRPRHAPLPGRRQAFRITRRRTVIKSGRTGGETAYGLTALPPERAGPAEALALNRGHWEIETRLHYVRDVAYDEERSRIRCGRLPRNLACLSSAAISILRLRGRFDGQPQGHRHYAAREREALREVLAPTERGRKAIRRCGTTPGMGSTRPESSARPPKRRIGRRWPATAPARLSGRKNTGASAPNPRAPTMRL